MNFNSLNAAFCLPNRRAPGNSRHYAFLKRLKKSFVMSFCGSSKICCEVPSSTITPFPIKITCFATSRANAISCVTMIIVSPSLASVRITSRTSPTICGSRAEVGSSKSRIYGSMARALAIATLCFCPPESCFGFALI